MSNQTHSFVGNLTRDPELRHIASGDAVANFSVAVNGRTPEDTVYFECETWGKNAEIVTKFFKKGKPIVVLDAIIRNESWTDKNSGEKRSRFKFKVNRLGFAPTGKGEEPAESSEEDEDEPVPAPTPSPARKKPDAPKKASRPASSEEDGDIPF